MRPRSNAAAINCRDSRDSSVKASAQACGLTGCMHLAHVCSGSPWKRSKVGILWVAGRCRNLGIFPLREKELIGSGGGGGEPLAEGPRRDGERGTGAPRVDSEQML